MILQSGGQLLIFYTVHIQVYSFLYACLHALLLSDRENAWKNFCDVLVDVVRPHTCFFLAAARDMLFQRPFLPKRPCLRNCLMELYLSNNVIEDLVVTLVSFQGKTTDVCSWDLKWRWDFQLSMSQICRIVDCISGIFAGSIGLHSLPQNESCLKLNIYTSSKWGLIHSLKESICRCPQYGH